MSQRSSQLQGVGRAFAVLELLAERPMHAVEVVEALGIKWATAHRTLTYLTEIGYLDRNEDGTYSVGVQAYSVGSAYIPHSVLCRVAQPHLERAAHLAGATAQLTKPMRQRAVVLSRHAARPGHVPETTIGCNFPLHCGSKGHVLLAYADTTFLDGYLASRLEPLTPYTITDPRKLRRRLTSVCNAGYAITDRDIRPWSSSVAAPIRSPADDVIASVTLIVRPAELRARRRQLVEVTTRTAAGISRSLRA